MANERPTQNAASVRRWLSWPLYVVGTAVIRLADWLNPDEEPFNA